MENSYNILGVKPGCSKRQLRDAYKKAIAKLEPDDMIGEERITQAYLSVQADRKHRRIKKKQYGIWKPSKEFHAPYTGPHGSISARNAMSRFRFLTLFQAVGIVLLSWAVYFFCLTVTPNLFPSSQYPQLAKTFSERLTAACAQLLCCVVFTILYVCHYFRRREDGLRRVSMGFLFGITCLIVGLLVPQNQFVNTTALVSDIQPLVSNQLSSTKNILLEDGFLQTKNSFGNTYTYKIEKSKKSVYIPSNLLTNPDGTVHQASVTFLPHTYAAARVEIRAMKNYIFSCIGDCFYIDVPGNAEDIESLYLKRSTASLVIEHKNVGKTKGSKLTTDFCKLFLKDKLGQPLISEITADKVAASILPNKHLLLAFTAEDTKGGNTCIAAEINQKTGKVENTFQLKGNFIFRLFSCAGRYYFFSESPVKTSFTDRQYFLQVYDPAQQKIVYTSPQSFTLSLAPHVASFSHNGVWISKHSNGEEPIGKFPVPKIYMK